MDHALDSFFQEQAWLRALARSLVLDDGEADDLVQETWLAALRNPPQSPENPRRWLRVVVKRLASRRRARRYLELEEPDAHIASGELPDEVAARWESTSLLREAIEGLPRPERDVVLLRFQEGASLEEVATTLNLSQRTVSERLRSARGRLRIRLGRDYESEEAGLPPWLAALTPLMGAKEWISALEPVVEPAAPVTGSMLGAGTLGKLLAFGVLALLGAWILPTWWGSSTPPGYPDPSLVASAEIEAVPPPLAPGAEQNARASAAPLEVRGSGQEPLVRRFVEVALDTEDGPLLDYRVRVIVVGSTSAGTPQPLSIRGAARVEIPATDAGESIELILEPERAVGSSTGRPSYRLTLDPRALAEVTPLRLRLERGGLDVPVDAGPVDAGPVDADPGGADPGPRTVGVRRVLLDWPQPAGAAGPWTVHARAPVRRGVAEFADLPCGTFELEFGEDRAPGDALRPAAGTVVVLPPSSR